MTKMSSSRTKPAAQASPLAWVAGVAGVWVTDDAAGIRLGKRLLRRHAAMTPARGASSRTGVPSATSGLLLRGKVWEEEATL